MRFVAQGRQGTNRCGGNRRHRLRRRILVCPATLFRLGRRLGQGQQRSGYHIGTRQGRNTVRYGRRIGGHTARCRLQAHPATIYDRAVPQRRFRYRYVAGHHRYRFDSVGQRRVCRERRRCRHRHFGRAVSRLYVNCHTAYSLGRLAILEMPSMRQAQTPSDRKSAACKQPTL